MVRGGLTQAEGHPPWVPVTPAVTVSRFCWLKCMTRACAPSKHNIGLDPGANIKGCSVMAAYTVFIRMGRLHVLLQQLENLKNSVSEKKLNGYTVPLSGISLSTVHS